jgi:ClpP class serine protease
MPMEAEEELSLDKSSDETKQSRERRRELLRKLQDAVGRTIIAFFTSQTYPVAVDQTDADMLEDVLRQTSLRNGLCLVLDTPGGDGIAAERIVRICRVYSDNKFDVFVARRAKSAGTIIAMGSNKILMGETSALGRIDPQILIKEKNGAPSLIPAHVVVTRFDELLNKAKTSKGHAEIYLRKLTDYDDIQIELIRRQLRMTEDIAVRCLKQGMLAHISKKEIEKKIALFVTPVVTKAHTRDIFFDEVQKTGLKIELVRHDNPIWGIASEFYALAWDFVTSKHCKLIESPDCHFSLPWQGK